jgi:hypothetical protein
MVWIAQVFSITYDPLLITPAVGFDATGCVGGPFSTTNETFSLSNMGTNSLTWSLANTSSWLNASPGGGTLATGGTTNVTVSLSSNAYSLTSRIYTATVWFTNLNDGVVQSRQFTLAVGLPTILSQPQGLAVCDGSPASFNVSVSGTPTLYFQWQKNGTNLTDGTNISGSTTATLVLNPTTTNDDGSYTVIITNTCGSVISSVASLVVVSSPVVLPPGPTNQTVMAGGTATFSVAVFGIGPFTYQWQLNGTNLPNGIITTVAGNGGYGYSGDNGRATNASLNNPYSVAVDAASNLFIADRLNNVIRKVDPNGFITTVAGNYNTGGSYGGDGSQATNASLNDPFGVAMDASGDLFIADTENQRIREVVLFATYPTLTLCNVTTNNAGNYTVFITSPYGSVTSSVATLTVASSPIIYQIVCNANGSVMLNLLTTPNISSRVLATTNLTPPVVWQPIYSNVAGANGAWQFTDTNASNYPVRFYRSSTP